MSAKELPRFGYVLKRYPRYSETFIVNEILAHEAAGADVEIFSLLPPSDTHFQNIISQVRAPVHYPPGSAGKSTMFWETLRNAAQTAPGFWAGFQHAQGEDARTAFLTAWLVGMTAEHRLTHLHAHFATAATSVARLAARLAGIRYSFTAHAKDIFHQSIDTNQLQCKLEDASKVITVSDYNVDYLRTRFPSAADHIVRVYNGLDLDQFPYQTPHKRTQTVIFVGRLIEKKGVADLIDACSILSRRLSDFECKILGVGELGLELAMQVERLGLQGTVKLLGPRPQDEVRRLVQEAAVMAVPCVVGSDGNRDGLPTVLLEAMALGTPCISTNVTGIPEVILHGETGVMVSQHDPGSLAAAIEHLFLNADLRATLASNARKLIEREFDIRRNASRMREHIFSVSAGNQLMSAEVAG